METLWIPLYCLLAVIVVTCEARTGTERVKMSVNQDDYTAQITLAHIRNSGLLHAFEQGGMATHRWVLENLRANNNTLDFSEVSYDRDDRLRSSAIPLKLLEDAVCKPRPTVVSLSDWDHQHITVPECVEIPRCGGCCFHPLLECVPTMVNKIYVRMIKISLVNNMLATVPKVESVLLDKHKSCDCVCVKKESECRPEIHDYKDCTCMCKDTRMKNSCAPQKDWNEETCQCECSHKCNHQDYIQDQGNCRCILAHEVELYRVVAPPQPTPKPTEEMITARPTSSQQPCSSHLCRQNYQPVLQLNGRCSCYRRRRSRART